MSSERTGELAGESPGVQGKFVESSYFGIGARILVGHEVIRQEIIKRDDHLWGQQGGGGRGGERSDTSAKMSVKRMGWYTSHSGT
jgi:hypothetical protein